MLFHSILAIFHTLPGKILFVGTVAMDAVLSFLFFAVSEPEISNRTLILMSIGGNFTMLIVSVIAGWFQLKSARIGAARFEMLKPLVELPKKVEALEKGINGNVAKVAAARAEGKLEARTDADAKKGADALAREDAAPTVENTP